MKKTSDDVKRDEVLKRMLQMPHKPHVMKKNSPKKSMRKTQREK
jgi:hypothetical protein